MSVRRSITLTIATLTATGLLTACGNPDASTDVAAPKGKKDTGINISPDQDRLRGKKVDAIAALVPEDITGSTAALLQHRSLFRTFHPGGTLREHLGLARPASRYARAETASKEA
ncbi:hypothetical protein SCYAM73S_00274 [Streptomyces cyaneofuscatus]